MTAVNSDSQLLDPNDLWKYKALNTSDTASVNKGDPCALVYPMGLWKMPTSEDYGVLTVEASVGNLLRLGNPNRLYLLNRGEPSFGGILGIILPTKYFEIVVGWSNVS